MVFKARRDRLYCYKSVRDGQKVRSVYVGSAEFGRAVAAIEDEQRRADVERRKRDAAETAELAGWSRAVDMAVAQALEAAGYHKHKRGEWRRRRAMTSTMTTIDPTAGAKPPARDVRPVAERTKEIMARWKELGRPITAVEAEALIRDHPGIAYGLHPAMQFRTLLMNRCGIAADELTRLVTERKFRRIEEELAGTDSTPMERLLAERAAICWLDLYTLQQRAESRKDPLTLAQAVYEQKRIDAADRRFIRAIKALATVRRLRLPAIALVGAVNIHPRTGPELTPATIEVG